MAGASDTYQNVFSYMLDTAEGYLETFFAAGSAAMQGWVATLFVVVGGVYFALYGWMMMYGYVQGTITDIAKQAAKFIVVYTIATFAPAYSLFIVDFFWAVPEAIGGGLLTMTADAAGTSANTADGIADVMEAYNVTLREITGRVADSGRFVPGILAGFLAILMQIPVVAALFVVLIAKVGLSVMIVLGPLLIICSLFGWTKGLFEGWLRQILTFVMTSLLAYAVIALMMSMLSSFADDLNSGSGAIEWVNAIPLALVGIVCALVFLQVPQFAAGLVGGVGLSDMGATRFGAGKARTAGARTGRSVSRVGAGLGGAAMSKMAPKVTSKLQNAIQAKAPVVAEKIQHYSGAEKPKAQMVKKQTPKGDS